MPRGSSDVGFCHGHVVENGLASVGAAAVEHAEVAVVGRIIQHGRHLAC